MNEPIISPWVFYFTALCDNIGVLCLIAVFIITIVILAKAFVYDESILENFKKIKVIFLILMLYLTFCPTSDTIYKMLVASQVTPHNIEVMGDTVENSIDYIFEKIQSLDDTEESEEE